MSSVLYWSPKYLWSKSEPRGALSKLELPEKLLTVLAVAIPRYFECEVSVFLEGGALALDCWY
jgi:hypothetical protein